MELHFKRTGNGPALILLHGLLGSLDNLAPFAERASAHFTAYSVDQRNHGLSPHADEMSYESMAQDLAGLLDRHDLPTASVLGHSMGGKTAMQFALAHPERVTKLVVADTSPREHPPSQARVLEAMLALDPASLVTRTEAERELTKAIPDATTRRFLLKNLANDGAGGLRWKCNLRSLHENYPQLRAALRTARPHSKPALFIAGGNSDYLGEADMPLIKELFPRAELKTIARAGHWVHADAPVEFAEIVLEFLLRES